jgi:predicted outer membrane repeat protein
MNKPRACISLALLCISVAACKPSTPEAPQIYTVGCSTADLITAVNQANAASGPAEINLAADCEYLFTSVNNTQNIDGVAIPSALPAITGEIKLVGNNAVLNTNIMGSNIRFGFLLVQPEGKLKTDRLTMRNGYRALGAAVYVNRGWAYFDETTFSGNIAEGVQSGTPAEGGAIYNREGSVTVIGKSILKNNGALNGFLEPDLDSAGGGIFSSNGFLLVTRTTFEGNVADSGGGIAIRRAASGAGPDGTFISMSEFLENSNSAIDAEGERTAFYISSVDFTRNESSHSGGALYIKDSILDLSGGGFVENSADTCGAVDSSQNSELLVSSSMFYKNTADGPGGALCHSGDSLKISNSEFAFNESGTFGGGVYATRWVSVRDTFFTGNLATEYGGGVFASDSIDIQGSSFSENTALRGGGLYAGWLPNVIGPMLTANVTQSMFSGNHAVRAAGNPTLSAGGGIAFAGNWMNVKQSTIWANEGGDTGGGLFIGRGDVSVENTTISENLSQEGAGASMTANSTTSFVHVTMLDNHPRIGVVLYVNAPTTMKNSVIAGAGGDTACLFDVANFHAVGVNLDSDGSCDFSLTSADPGFSDLAEHGGPTLTNMPVFYSPAIDAAADCGGLTEDQRGQPRPFGSACDLGAVERNDSDGGGIMAPSMESPPSDSPDRCEYTAKVNASCRAGDDMRTQLIQVLTKGDMVELLSLNPEFTHGSFALPDGRSCWVWMPLMEGPADPSNNCNVPINNPPDYVPDGPACSADLPKAQCEAAGGTMSGASSSASECICPSAASVTDPSTDPQSVACAATGDRGINPSAGLESLTRKFSILWSV